jgi:hypothetical protein
LPLPGITPPRVAARISSSDASHDFIFSSRLLRFAVDDVVDESALSFSVLESGETMMDFCSLRTFDEWRGDDNSSDVEEAEKPWHGAIVMAAFRRTADAVRSGRDRIMVNVGTVWMMRDERVRVRQKSNWESFADGRRSASSFFRRSEGPIAASCP